MADDKIAAAGAVAVTANGTTPAAPTVAGEAQTLGNGPMDESLLGRIAELEARAADPTNPDPSAQLILAGLRAQIAQASQQQQASLAAAGAVAVTVPPTTETPGATIAAAGAVAATEQESTVVNKLSGSSQAGDALLEKMGLPKAAGGRSTITAA